MAITFARLMPILLTVWSGAVRVLAYTARTAIYDPRIQKLFDYTHLDADFACGGVILPEDHPPGFADLDALAVNLDLAEFAKVRTSLAERDRLPQVGLALVVALPPDGEVWLHEARELMRRIVRRPRGSEAIAIHWAIHEATINRHGHAYYALRAFDANGNAGPRIRDLMARHRSTILGTGIVEGVDWPSLVWETQQAYFEELGLDLVVDPIAPAPGRHLLPVVYANGAIHNEPTRAQVARSREDARAANVEAIRGTPTQLVDTLLRGRSSMRVAEFERLCAKFVDHPSERMSIVERILTDNDIVTLTEDGSDKPRYLTTRRIHDLVAEAAGLMDRSSEGRIATFTATDHTSLVRRIVGHYHAGNHPDRPEILGHALADCEETAFALAAHAPVAGTINMAVTGPDYLLAIGRERDLAIRPGRTVIVPHAERIDDQRLARLLQEAQKHEAELILGHDQSSRHGIVNRGLAAYAADRMGPSTERYGQGDVERLLRAGLIRLAINAMADGGLLRFGAPGQEAGNASLIVACQDRHRMNELARTISEQRVRAKIIEPVEELTTFGGTLNLSVGEWIVTTQACEDPPLEVGQFAQIVGIGPSKSAIEVAHHGEVKRIDLERFADIRSATTVTIREARGLPRNTRLIVELTGHRHIWAALLLVARRHAHAHLYIDTALARSVEELTEIAARSLPAALPHQRETKPDLNADTGEIPPGPPELENFPEPLGDPSADIGTCRLELEDFPEAPFVPLDPPRPIHLEENVRSMIVSNSHAHEGYRMLFEHVGPHNPNGRQNMERVLGLCTSELTATLVRFLADLEEEPIRDELRDFDFPLELPELDPTRWSIQDIERAKYDLQSVAIPGSNWQLRPPLPAAPTNTLDVRGNVPGAEAAPTAIAAPETRLE